MGNRALREVGPFVAGSVQLRDHTCRSPIHIARTDGWRTWSLLVVMLLLACGQGPGGTNPLPTPAAAGQTWTWDGAWKLMSGSEPEHRYGAAMAFDAARGVTLLFGGYGTTGFLGDTWTWDGNRWARQSPAHAPPARGGAAMAFDRASQLVVLFGGTGGGPGKYLERNDLWTWDGKDWTRATQTDPHPGARAGAVMFYDAAVKRLVLFGGEEASLHYFADLWAWEGNQWSLLAAAEGPQGRSDAAVAYDAGQSELLVFGGQGRKPDAPKGAQGVELSDTWVLAAGGWREVNSTPGPTKRYGAATAYDPRLDRVLVLGGFDCPKLRSDLWAWTGSAWQPIANRGSSPPARWGAALVYDPLRKVDVLFGGSVDSGCV